MATAPSPRDRSESGNFTYLKLREHHKKAYDLLSIALEIDESGDGDPTAAIDYYSRGVAALEEGIACEVYAVGEEKEKAERLKEKMISNLEMTRDRVNVLLTGADLKGKSRRKSQSPPSKFLPTESLRMHKVPSKQPPMNQISLPQPYQVPRQSPSKQPTKQAHPEQLKRPRVETDGKSKQKVNNLKGVDEKLAEKILDELIEPSELSVTWDDVVGLELPKRTLQEIVLLPAVRPELFTGLRSPARGLLLFGPPGNGKTMLAKALAHESKANFFNISASALTSKWVGDGEKMVKAMFAIAREVQPSIIFMDEVDALLTKRSDSENDALRRLKNEFLQCFDGMKSLEGERILVMAATNRPHELDDAALRRFEKRIYIPLPSKEARKIVLIKLLRQHQNTLSEHQVNEIARITEGYSGSDLTALAKDAALGPIRELDYQSLRSVPENKVRPIKKNDLEASMKTVRPSVAQDLIATLEEWNAHFGVSS